MVHHSPNDKGYYLVLAFFGGDVECRVEVLGCRVDAGSVLEEQHHDVDVPQPGGYVERSLFFLE